MSRRASERAPASERPAAACVAGERSRGRERSSGSGCRGAGGGRHGRRAGHRLDRRPPAAGAGSPWLEDPLRCLVAAHGGRGTRARSRRRGVRDDRAPRRDDRRRRPGGARRLAGEGWRCRAHAGEDRRCRGEPLHRHRRLEQAGRRAAGTDPARAARVRTGRHVGARRPDQAARCAKEPRRRPHRGLHGCGRRSRRAGQPTVRNAGRRRARALPPGLGDDGPDRPRCLESNAARFGDTGAGCGRRPAPRKAPAPRRTRREEEAQPTTSPPCEKAGASSSPSNLWLRGESSFLLRVAAELAAHRREDLVAVLAEAA